MDKVEWKCPRCQAEANACGKKIEHKLDGGYCLSGKNCMGFICDCDHDTGDDHGITLADRCPNANCYHCGWGGEFPKMPGKMPAWAKKALDAGWKPPEGWQP